MLSSFLWVLSCGASSCTPVLVSSKPCPVTYMEKFELNSLCGRSLSKICWKLVLLCSEQGKLSETSLRHWSAAPWVRPLARSKNASSGSSVTCEGGVWNCSGISPSLLSLSITLNRLSCLRTVTTASIKPFGVSFTRSWANASVTDDLSTKCLFLKRTLKNCSWKCSIQKHRNTRS